MDERWRLMRAIEAEPDDDTVRLVYADWLEEHGEEPRARLIRLQCADKSPQGEIDALLQKHKAAWTAGLPAWARDVGFRRGFPWVFCMTGKQFLDGAAPIRDLAPLDTLFLHLLKGRTAALFASEHLAGVGWLRLDGCQLADADIPALAGSPHLGSVRRLWLGRPTGGDASNANKFSDTACCALADAGNLPSLIELSLDGNSKITLAGVRRLAESPLCAGLESLDVSGCAGGPALGGLFADASCCWESLDELRLNSVKLGDTGARVLAGSSRLSGLRRLWLTQNKISDAGAAALADSPQLGGLEDLDLWKNNLTDAGVRSLAESPHMRKLKRLELSENRRITDAGALFLMAGPRRWRHLGLRGTGVTTGLLQQAAARCKE